MQYELISLFHSNVLMRGRDMYSINFFLLRNSAIKSHLFPTGNVSPGHLWKAAKIKCV